MPITLMYITKDPAVALVAESSGVDWIFVDMEFIGKEARQGHLDTVISRHTIDDVRSVRAAISSAQLLVRLNPMHDESATEVEMVVEAGADIMMLPYFTRFEEASKFVDLVAGRAKVCLLIETPEAAESIHKIAALPGIDYVHIGLNDLHLAYQRPFMFDLLADGTVDRLCSALEQAAISYGFGGIARLGMGELPAELILAEHYRLGSTMAILSRSFFDTSREVDAARLFSLFSAEVGKIRKLEEILANADTSFFERGRREVIRMVQRISAQRSQGSSMIQAGAATHLHHNLQDSLGTQQ